MLPIPRCSECGDQLPPKKPGPGKNRVYCSDRCRKRAERRRKAVAQWQDLQPATLTPYVGPDGPVSPPPPRKQAHPDEQVARAILEARGIAGAFAVLAREVRPQFAWRCEKVADGLHALLDEYFAPCK
ncbi:MAG: hypothetical protein GX624_03785 [Actinobacteria bacterium]|nr:hypothetical protein [Actinomycetota bacterium]